MDTRDPSVYLKGCHYFDLWTYHNPLAQARNKDIQALTDRMQKAFKRGTSVTR